MLAGFLADVGCIGGFYGGKHIICFRSSADIVILPFQEI